MDINSISMSWQTFLAYASTIITVSIIIAYLRFRVEAVEKNDKKQDVDISKLQESQNKSERTQALLLQRMDMLLEQIKLIRDGK